MDTKYKLVGSPCSLYTGKLRSYLNYKAVPFEEILSTQRCFKELIVPRTGVRYIPVLVTPEDEVWQDTTVIIDKLENRFTDKPLCQYEPLVNLISELLHFYGDEWLVIPAMHYRWNIDENREFAYHEFGSTAAPEANEEEQKSLGEKLAERFAGALPILGVTKDTITAIETSYHALLADLDLHFSDNDFLLGSQPTFADFGFYGPLYAHLGRDPYSKRLMQETAPQVFRWTERMAFEQPYKSEKTTTKTIDSLIPVLKRMGDEMSDVITETVKQVTEFAAHHDKGPVPRVIGDVSFTINGSAGHRKTFPFLQWKWQRVQNHYQQLRGNDKVQAKTILQKSGLMSAIDLPLESRLTRRDNQLWFL